MGFGRPSKEDLYWLEKANHYVFSENKSIKTFVSNLEQLENDNNLHMVIEYYGNNQEWKNG